MAEREARVVEIMPVVQAAEVGVRGLARVQFDESGGCGRCHETGGCGGVSIAQPVCRTPKTMLIPDYLGVSVGDRVAVAVPDDLLSRGATRAYLIPLLLLFAGSVLGAALLPDLTPMHWQINRDVGAMAGAGIGLILGWWQLQYTQKTQHNAVLRMVRRLS